MRWIVLAVATVLLACKESRPVDGVAVQVSTNGERTCAVVMGGKVWCWGWNYRGSLGIAETGDRHAPVHVPVRESFISVSVGASTSCAVTLLGKLWCWGPALGTAKDEQTAPRRVEGVSDAVRVSVGARHACMLAASGAVACWGDNDAGQVDGRMGIPRASPVPVAVPPAADIVAGWDYSCALDRQGAVWCWGHHPAALEDEAARRRDVPGRATLKDVVAIGGGGSMWDLCAVKRDGTVWCWGDRAGDRKPQLVVGVEDAESVSGGCAVTRRENELWCWSGDRTDPRAGRHAPRRVAKDIRDASGSSHNVCAITEKREVGCLGVNLRGVLGTGDTEHRDELTIVIRPATPYGVNPPTPRDPRSATRTRTPRPDATR